MKTTKHMVCMMTLLCLGFALGACGDGKGPSDATTAGDGDGDGDGDTCSSFDTEHLSLLNAETDAVVVHKTPTNPPLE